jgi:glycerate 2-kinase
MKILIAADSFKDALDSFGVCEAIQKGIKTALPNAATIVLPLSDGGEGLSDIATYYFGLQRIEVATCDALFRPHTATYGLSQDGTTAFIEMAKAAGLQLLTTEERNPLKTSTFGVGLLIVDAIKRGATRIIIGLGGSATNDAGMGMAAALGWQFLDENAVVLSPIGANLNRVRTIVPPENWPKDVAFEAICDVKNPLFGPNGAAYVFAKQKGASDTDIKTLDDGLRHFAVVAQDAVIDSPNRPKSELCMTAGAGAAGGLGFGCLFFLNVAMKRGIDSVLDWASFDDHLAGTNWIFTGEGRLDSQTLDGKLMAGIAERAKGKPIIALCGALELLPCDVEKMGIKAAFSITPKPCLLSEALANTAINLTHTAFHVAQLLL